MRGRASHGSWLFFRFDFQLSDKTYNRAGATVTGIGLVAAGIVHMHQDYLGNITAKIAAALGNILSNDNADIAADAAGRLTGITRICIPGSVGTIYLVSKTLKAGIAGIVSTLNLLLPLRTPEIAGIPIIDASRVVTPDNELALLI